MQHCPTSGTDAPLRRGILRCRFAHFFVKTKKSTDSKTGLPSVALAKDGGGCKKNPNNSLKLKIEIFFKNDA